MIGRADLRGGGPAHQHDAIPLGKTAIAVVILTSLLYLGWILAKMDFTIVDRRYDLTAVFHDAGGLDPKDRSPVVINGVPAGRLTDLTVRDGKAYATLSMIAEMKGKVHHGATIELVPRSGLQDVTIDIHPGDQARPALGDGDTIGSASTRSYVAVDKLTGVLDADTRAYAQIALQALGRGLRGRDGQLQGALAKLGPTLSDTTRLTALLNRRRDLLADVVDEADAVFTAVGRRGQDLTEAIRLGQQTVATTARRDADLAAATDRLPAALSQLRAALTGVQELGRPLNPALRDLQPVADALPSSLRSVREFIPDAGGATTDLDRLARRAGPAVADLRRLLGILGPVTGDMRPGTGRLLDVVKPVAEDVGPGGGAHDLVSNVSGVTSTSDQTGAVARGSVVAVEQPYGPNFGLPLGTSREGMKLMRERLDAVLNLTCLLRNALACAFRTMTPGLASYLPPSQRRAAPIGELRP